MLENKGRDAQEDNMNQSAEQKEIEKEEVSTDRPSQRRMRRGRIGIGMLTSLSFASVIFLFLFLSLSGRMIPVPEFVRARIEAQVNSRLGEDQVQLGGISLAVGRDGIPHVVLQDVGVGNPAGGAVAVLNRLRARLSPGRLLQGEIAASELRLDGAQITLRRTALGNFAFQSGQLGDAQAQSVPDLLDTIDAVFANSVLAALKSVQATGIVLTLEDARSGRIWQATNASLIVRLDKDATTLTLVSDVFNGTDQVAEIQVSMARNLETSGVSLGATVAEMPAADIALQSPALAWLGVLNAPLSGSVRAEIGADGELASLAGTLDIQAGALQPLPDVAPVGFESARAYFVFDSERQRIDFSEIALVSEQGRLEATGHTYLAELAGPWPQAFLGQFSVAKLDYRGEGVFNGPLALEDIHADLRLRLDPFTVDIGQVSLTQGEADIRATGQVSAASDGWHVSVDAQSPAILSARVLNFWPIRVSPVTRGWLYNNLRAGTLENVSGGMRFNSGEEPDAVLSFEFSDGNVSFIRAMPPLTNATGRATLGNKRFALKLEKGLIDAGPEGVLDASGSVFAVPDTRQKPSTGEITIRAEGPLVAALTVLNEPPLRIMDRAKRQPDIAEAHAVAVAKVRLPLKDRIKREEVFYDVSAILRNVSSDNIVAGRTLTSREMVLNATPEGVGLDGALQLDGVPARASWRQPLGEAVANGATVEGTIELSDTTMKNLNIPLPDGMIGGRGTGRYTLALPVQEPPRLSLTSDLAGVSLAIDELGWRKAASAPGGLELSATLGAPPVVDDLSLSAPGLALSGRIELSENGGFSDITFDSIRVGRWLDASVKLVPRGPGLSPGIEVASGRIDVRDLPAGGSGGGDGAPIEVELTELVVSDSISLSPLTGRLQQGRAGLSGQFTARVNGETPVRGTLAPAKGGTAIRLQSDNAGGVIRDAGLTPNAQSGTLDLVLNPVAGAPAAVYDGQFLIKGIRLRKAPIMADLLDAISVVGLLDQLQGPGILFSTVDGRFRLTPHQLVLRKAAAVGGSLGVSADGIYDFRVKKLDFSGVISPVYFVNAIGSVVSRRGEGLFGFNYRMTGLSEDPRVSVNPLSILTPGIFRDIFRRSPPRE